MNLKQVLNHSADQKYHNILYMNLKQVLNHSADQKYHNILYESQTGIKSFC